jgi:hypothetical protein
MDVADLSQNLCYTNPVRRLEYVKYYSESTKQQDGDVEALVWVESGTEDEQVNGNCNLFCHRFSH